MQSSTMPAHDAAPAQAPAAGPRLHLAISLSGLEVGGVQRTMLTLAGALAGRGHRVDVVVPSARGPFRSLLPAGVRLVDLETWWLRLPPIAVRKRHRVMASPPLVARYLRRERPQVLLSASHYVNVAALLGRRLAGTGTPLAVSQRTHISRAVRNAWIPGLRRPFLGAMVRRTYPWAGAIVAVSDGVADDLARTANLPRARIHTIYNPVATPDIPEKAREPVEHPWLAAGEPPVVLGVGRLAAQKDFPTLLRAFARLRARRPARLVILGEGRKRRALEAQVRDLGLTADVDLPGYRENPFAWMARAQLFVLSSAYEGLPGALIQALACGCPVVSADCPSGPREVLAGGEYGPLVPVGDDAAMAAAMARVLDAPPARERQQARAAAYSVEACADRYEALLLELAGADADAARGNG